MNIKIKQIQEGLTIESLKSGRKSNQTFVKTSLYDIAHASEDVGKSILGNATTKIITKQQK